jgi:hypothetical protein
MKFLHLLLLLEVTCGCISENDLVATQNSILQRQSKAVSTLSASSNENGYKTKFDEMIGRSKADYKFLFDIASAPENCWAIRSHPQLRDWLNGIGYDRDVEYYSFAMDWTNRDPSNTYLVLATKDNRIIGYAFRGYGAPQFCGKINGYGDEVLIDVDVHNTSSDDSQRPLKTDR